MKPELLYIFDEDRNVIPCEDPSEWRRWMQVTNRTVCATRVEQYNVSTVFLGADHATTGDRLLVFETKVFGEPELSIFARCSTWDEAVIQHRRLAAEVEIVHVAGAELRGLPVRKTRQERRIEIVEAQNKERTQAARRVARAESAFAELSKLLDDE